MKDLNICISKECIIRTLRTFLQTAIGYVLANVSLHLGGIDFTDDKSKVFITIQEGKYHQVKRMFAYVKLNVTYLKRISMGTLNLDESLKPGEYRELTEDEINILKASTKTRP